MILIQLRKWNRDLHMEMKPKVIVAARKKSGKSMW